MSSWHAGQRPPSRRSTGRHGRLDAFRAWRRSRPFWGGLLMLLAGIELLAIPLSGVLIQGQVKLVIYIGIGGVFGVLIGALLVAAGIVVWVNPTHRVFYGIAGIILGILSFPASNLGGFFFGMLLAILGGALAFAWSPADPGSERRSARPDGPTDTPVDLPTLMGDDGPGPEDRRPSGGFGSGSGFGSASGFGPGYRMLALAGLPCLLFCASTASPSSASPSPSSSSSSSPAPSPSSAAASAKTAAAKTAAAKAKTAKAKTAAAKAKAAKAKAAKAKAAKAKAAKAKAAKAGKGGGLLPSAVPSSGRKNAVGKLAQPAAAATKNAATKNPVKKNAAKKNTPVNQVKPPSGLVAPSTPSVLTAKSSTLKQMNLVGVTTLPVGGGGSEKVLEFTASSASLSAVGITIHQSGHAVLTKTASLDMPSGMTLYTTKMCGQVEGIAPNMCFTPDTASQVELKVASALGQATPITMTNVTADQFLNVAATSEWGPLTMGAE